MDQQITYIASGTLLLVTALLVTVRMPEKHRSATRWLAAYFWTYAGAVIVTYLVLFGYALQWPHLFRLGYPFSLVFFPCAYLYLRIKLFDRPISRSDAWHLLPLLVFLVDYLPFFLQPAEVKRQLLEELMASQERVKTEFGEGWLMPPYGYTVLRYAVMLGYWLAGLALIRRARKHAAHPFHQEPAAFRHWLYWLVGSQALIFASPIASLLLADVSLFVQTLNLVALLASLVQCYYLIVHPEVLQTTETEAVYPDASTGAAEPALATVEAMATEEPITAGEGELPFSEAAMDEVGRMLQQLMEEQQPYLQPGLKLYDLAKLTGIGVHKISYYINNRLQTNFYGYLNGLRVAHFKATVNAAGLQEKTLEALAEASGFQSRSTFIRAFKQVTGTTPTAYFQQQKG